jgi:AmiR/NasT family two-component response regulator
VIEQAKGIVAEHSRINIDEAFDLLRGYARRHNRLLSQTARDVVTGALSADALPRTESGPPA